MRLFILVVMIGLSIAETKVETITCAETIRMSTVEHYDTRQYKDGTWSVIAIVVIPVEHNPWLADIYPGCTDTIMVKGIGESRRLDIARDIASMEARGNAVCIGHPHYEHYRVYDRYWEKDESTKGRLFNKLFNIGGK